MDTIKTILTKFNPKEDKYVTREFQTFAMYMCEKLGDESKKPLYMKYAKYIPRPVLEEALRFVVDSHARNKGALFMWKLREMGVFEKYKLPGFKKKKLVAVDTEGKPIKETKEEKEAEKKAKAEAKERKARTSGRRRDEALQSLF
jgi:hypothetical protein